MRQPTTPNVTTMSRVATSDLDRRTAPGALLSDPSSRTGTSPTEAPAAPRRKATRATSRSRPIFILSTARSGSTLLRYFVDSLPEIAAPGETNLIAVFLDMRHMARVLQGDRTQAQEGWRKACRRYADSTLGAYARSRGKPRWCDKSLPSSLHAGVLLEVFPEAQFLCLYRDFPDFAVSAIDASRWGFNAYGFDPYVRQSPDNFLRGLALYWGDHTSHIKDFNDQHPTSALAIRYEDILLDPEDQSRRLRTFLDSSAGASGLFDLALNARHDDGPGDHKIRWTAQLSDTLGGGWAASLEAIPPPIRARVEELRSRLNYPVAARLPQRREIDGAHPRKPPRALSGFRSSKMLHAAPLELERTLCIEMADTGDYWTLDVMKRTYSYGASPQSLRLVSTTAILDELHSGNLNPGVALKRGDLRVIPPTNGQELPIAGILEDAIRAIIPQRGNKVS